MQIMSINCPACGGVYDGRITSRFIICEYCGTRYSLGADELAALGFTDADGDGYDDEVDIQPNEEVDMSTDPMYQFARDACAKFLDEHGNHLDSFESTRKILAGLGIGGVEVYLIHDDTMFKSGKNGFAITSAGIYCREMGDRKAHFVSWDDFVQRKAPELVDSYIRQNGTSVCYFTDNNDCRDDLLSLYQRLWRHGQNL